MSLNEFRKDVTDEVAAILAPGYNIEVTTTQTVPHSSDGAITFPNLDDRSQGTKLIELECAPAGGQNERKELTPLPGFRRMEAMTKHRSHSVAFKRQVAEEFIAGETLHGLSKRHDISRQLIRIWVGKFEAGALDEDVQAADLLQEYEAKIAALERMVGRQALEIELLKGVLKHAPQPRSATTSIVTGPVASRSVGGAS
jgi:transposase